MNGVRNNGASYLRLIRFCSDAKLWLLPASRDTWILVRDTSFTDCIVWMMFAFAENVTGLEGEWVGEAVLHG